MANYWIKLYHEILRDRKLAKLDDRLWRRVIECFLLAGETNRKGYLPPLEDIAWELRADIEQLETEYSELIKIGILEYRDGLYFVRKFEDRQKPMDKAEYMRRKRNEYQLQQYDQDSYQSVTRSKTDTDIDTEQIDQPPGVWLPSAEAIFCKASGMATFPGGQRHYIAVVDAMRDTFGAERTIEAMTRHYQKWRSTKRKDGSGNYSGLNLTWIDRAQEELAGAPEAAIPDINTDPKAYAEYLAQKYEGA